jgi:aryl-alcohol dehydrogenase-like predicted oxidoreductase
MYYGSSTDEETSVKLLDGYLEAGGTFLDTANAYARWVEGCRGGESESLLGRWMADRGNRKDLFIASKVGFPSFIDDLDFGLSAAQIEKACEGSLKRMRIETIDLYYAHNDPRDTPVEERLEAFDRLVRAGKVRFIGASNTVAWRLEEARCASQQHGWPQYCCVQQRCSYVRPRAGAVHDPHAVVNNELLDYCLTKNVGLLAYSPLLSGAYVREDRSLPEEYLGPDTDARLTVLKEVAKETGATANQVVLAWMMQSEPKVIPLIAASREEQQNENLGALRVNLSTGQLERLSQANNIVQEHPKRQRPKIAGMKEG